MRTVLSLITVASLALFFQACNNQDPSACFTYSVQRNFNVQFLNCSEQASRFEWEFGDGNTGSGINPTHQYQNAGTYTVTLKAYFGDKNSGDIVTESIEVFLIEDPVACFESSTELSSPGQPIVFTNCSVNSFRYEWDFGDGNTSTALSPEHAFEESGTFTVLLKAYSADGAFYDSTSTSIKVGDKFITGMSLIDFPETNNGEDWDPELPFPLPIPGIGVEPDIKIGYTNQSGLNEETDVAFDVEDTPFEFSFGREIKVNDEDWTFTAFEDDGVFGSTEMGSWTGNLNELGAEGTIEIEIDEVIIELAYTIK
ncbi:MAG: PKD domain-containing protein [Bacteroidia bacterium]